MEEENNKKEVSKAEQGLFKKLVDATIILASLTGFLYASGMAYYSAFLKYWGLDALNFARSFHEMAYFGLITVFNFSVSWLPQLVLTISVLALVLMIAIPLSPEFGISKWIRSHIKLM
ncbi:hypothetical protein [Aliikangiella sp. IMCC44359]|uniref:hypothetical protein n=1 Tax=Aliikangiella sp. IMCC44359 TaxID=3459125 RepID=UPI00403AFB8A